jgi:signal transduction histidine kinase
MTRDAPSRRSIPEFIPPFAPDLEELFQKRYYASVHGTLRVASLLLGVLFLGYMIRDYADTHSLLATFGTSGFFAVFCLLLCGLTFWKDFEGSWKPVVTVGGVAAVALSLGGMAAFLKGGPPEGGPPAAMGPFQAVHLFYGQQMAIVMVCLSVFRLPFKWALGLQSGVLCAGTVAFVIWLVDNIPGAPNPLSRFLQPVLLVVFVVLLAAFVQEKLARSAFLANHLLDQERNDERRKREQTESNLRVLGQAIGGIVHDLGNPLAAVQMGAGTLEAFIEDGYTDQETLGEFTDAINHGARMLNYLRLSLMEQTRVLEGKPIPVDLQPASVRQIIEAGARYQKPNFAAGRTVSILGDDLEARVDAMKLTIVFMNLIGNALKYSDGEVRITWRAREDRLLIAVMDQGTSGKGITEAQARKLFVAFGRLDAHAGVEGTGLGLLSVRRVVEAHGGEVFLEGHIDGTPASGLFTTAQGTYPSMLGEAFSTAFVVVCPLVSPL